ncbi:hypothetical protein [Frigoribacterium sp. PhB118]|jgi:hypothetical protein|uniref:hypothetical protein n=1 Tax=Frigoribacterium sp. PhB118 TaxID=2485175 RepID=UPI000F46DD10|nr:hypothetical protein [Frigoribacterium sp. PhB118]ROS52498.1 hypothetical protein EDF21_2375 [Frigoribacterium sp. PhB118]
MNVLEDIKMWGMLPREVAYICSGIALLLTGLVTVAALMLNFPWMLIASAMGLGAVALLLKLSLHLKQVAYAQYEESQQD